MKTIWKFGITGGITHALMSGWKFVHGGFQDGVLYVWIELDPVQDIEYVKFKIFATGQDIPSSMRHIYTWQDGPFVWHLYAE